MLKNVYNRILTFLLDGNLKSKLRIVLEIGFFLNGKELEQTLDCVI